MHLSWQRGFGESFIDQRYSRRHVLNFDRGLQPAGSPSPLRDVNESGVAERLAKTRAIKAQSKAVARATASICNAEGACFGGTSGHVGFVHTLSVVPLPMSDASAVDPEELFIASLSSCHMLWFLSLAARRGRVVDHYEDQATGTLARDAQGRTAMTVVTLRPQVRWGGTQAPDAAAMQALHQTAHDACFIANSVHTDVRCEPRL